MRSGGVDVILPHRPRKEDGAARWLGAGLA
jgi:hypothetical protein